jgi:hypothetical protein
MGFIWGSFKLSSHVKLSLKPSKLTVCVYMIVVQSSGLFYVLERNNAAQAASVMKLLC